MAIDTKKVIELASRLSIESNERGIMAAFGVYAAINYNEFYFKVVSRVINAVNFEMAQVVEKKLYNAVQECGYHTFHGIRTSMHWREHILPLIQSLEDEVHALVAVTNIFGIGFIEIEEILPGEKLVTTVNNAYDPDRYLRQYGVQPQGRCYMFSACTASYMDLVYGPRYPTGMGTFTAREISCRSKGDHVCRFLAERSMKSSL
jgi:hypothetical protein